MSSSSHSFPPLDPPARLLMGPGPINADPRIHRAMAAPLVGQFDPVMTRYMNQTMAVYRAVFECDYAQTLLIDGTARAGIEAVVISAIEPGERVLVPVMGRFGHLLTEIAERAGAEVHTIDIPWGQVCTLEQLETALKTVRPSLVATVQGDTSTTMLQPLAGWGDLCHQHDALLVCDATASIVGNTLPTGEWQLDAVTCGLQKCLAGPPGVAPITLSPAFVERVNRRRHVEAGIRDTQDQPQAGPRIGSNYFDLPMIMDYWGERRLNHHTEASTMLYAAYEAGRIAVEEGLAAAVSRHRLHGNAMAAGVEGLGLALYGDQSTRMNNIVGVRIPEALDGEAVRAALLQDWGIEIGSSFGPLKGKIWRIGTMGYNARQDCVLMTLAALEQVLRRQGHACPQGGGVDAAYAIYQRAEEGAVQ
ncbi:alanine--glyoxylate aminotransferase family protein [Natronospirillum operosum]|uniref:Alanine--glyoxylate aminotransferase family protein n=1 Tax=Natronospirillum operosum TaxID=2759953 RepID=A0A4Z0W447_9GAMM|nr:alanine--glyoxylate aminotransferase family protein [Natronospirillum operosum]TGG92084.1 alanine--glyoxylate aminotransferase family protein [Natronospirillum operosum]